METFDHSSHEGDVYAAENGDEVDFVTTYRIDTPVEVDYYRNGCILHTVLRQLLKA